MSQAATGEQGTGPLRQMVALVRMELLGLRRNAAASSLVVVLPLAVGFLRIGGYSAGRYGVIAWVTKVVGTIGVIGVVFVHHHLITVYAARRQELVLKRLRAGLPSDRTILAGAASGTVVIFLAQAVILGLYGVLALDLPVPANPLTIALATLLNAALMAAVSAAMSAVTRSSEAAMLTSVPTMGLFLVTPGLLVPFGELPPAVESAAWFLPLGPFPEVARTAWLGKGPGGAELTFLGSVVDALPGLAVMSGWLILALLAVRYFFRWEPRHG